MKIAIIGKGNVGSALERGLKRAGHDVRASGRENVRETAEWGQSIILAVPFGAIDDALQTMSDAVNGKVLIDATNALDDNMALAIGCTTSGAEELQRKAPGAKVVKAFNTNFAQHMDSGHVADTPLTAFAAGDDEGARETVMQLAREIGFDAVNAGPLQNARWLETLGYLNIQLGYVVGHGTGTGFHYIH
ncbi:MAG TPA: NAD(P)-binding domain-containing protein [Thermoanaerobaculia bacterium]|nr:NAD(P)-binding domain-containing protein [Thermoanaerobaculia bacterium]